MKYTAVFLHDGNRTLVTVKRGGCEPEIADDITLEEAKYALRGLATAMSMLVDPFPGMKQQTEFHPSVQLDRCSALPCGATISGTTGHVAH